MGRSRQRREATRRQRWWENRGGQSPWLRNYHVDPAGNNANDGSYGHPWQTLAHAVTQLGPKDTLWIHEGTYAEGNVICPSEGRHGAKIQMRGRPNRDRPLWNGGGGGNTCFEVQAADRGHWWLRYIEFDTDGDWDMNGHNCAVGHNFWPAAEGSVPGWRIKDCVSSAAFYLFGPDTLVDGNEVDGTGQTHADEGAIIVRGAVATDIRILCNDVHDWNDRVIWVFNFAHRALVHGNHVYDGGGLGIDLDGNGSANRIEDGIVTENTVHDCVDDGIELENCKTGTTGPLVARNTIYNCRWGIILIAYVGSRAEDAGGLITDNLIYECTDYGMQVDDTGGWDIDHNTIVGLTGAFPVGIRFSGTEIYLDSIQVRMNIICSGDGTIEYIYTFPASLNLLADVDYNQVNGWFGALAEEQTTWGNSPTLAQWRIDSGDAANSDDTAPTFTNPAGDDYTLQAGSAGVDDGADYGSDYDLDGVARPQGGGFDRGCYER